MVMITPNKVQVWIFTRSPKPQVLIFRTNPTRGSFWQPITGWVDEGESLAEAALREACEETGRDSLPQPVDLGFGFEFESRHGKTARESVFAVEVAEAFTVRLDPSEHSGARWCAPAEALIELKFESNQESLKKLLTVAQIPL